MSKPRYQWWGYAKSMVRRYPDKVNPDEYQAVRAAILETQRMHNSDIRMDVVKMVLMNGTHDLEGAAIVCNVSHETARRCHADFIRAVGKHFSCKSLIYA